MFGDLKSSTEVVFRLLEETIQTVANGGLTSVAVDVGSCALRTLIAPIKVFGCSSVVGVDPPTQVNLDVKSFHFCKLVSSDGKLIILFLSLPLINIIHGVKVFLSNYAVTCQEVRFC